MATGRADGPRRAGIAVIGAGPAGLAAAVAAADVGADVVLLDAEAGPGGQFWRHPAPAGGAAGVGPFAGGAPVDRPDVRQHGRALLHAPSLQAPACVDRA